MNLRESYLTLLEAALTGTLNEDPSIAPWTYRTYNPELRAVGADWPSSAPTMIGTARMANLRQVCERAIIEDVPGDFLEAGVWRGGACIYMRGIASAWRDDQRRVFVVDSFRGSPSPDAERYPADTGDKHHEQPVLVVSRKTVEDNFRRYGLLDERVVFLEGWFKDILPGPVERLAVLRVDGDMYESTMQVLESCYDKVSRGGAVIIDDYNSVSGCKQAADDFRSRHRITAPIVPIDPYAVWWQI